MVCSSSGRSVSLPMEPNAIMGRISRELRKLKTWEESSTSAAETISIGLSGIADLYDCVDEMLTSTREGRVVELLEASSKLLEVCSATREMAIQMKEACGELLQCAIEGTIKESSISAYVSSRKKIIKSSKQTLASLNTVSMGLCGGDDDEEVSDVVRALRCISIINLSIHESALMFLGSKPKCVGKKSMFSKLMGGKGKGELMSRNELENVDVAVCGLSGECDEKMRLARKRLEALEGGIKGIQIGLESVFKKLTQTRVLLMNILSP